MHSSNSTLAGEPAQPEPIPIPKEVVALCRRLREAGYAAYVVGGAVRDLLRQAAGSGDCAAKDFDVATAAPPEEVVRLFGSRRTIPTGIAHGTVTVLCDRPDQGDERPRHVEVTTFRGETGYSDGRRPDRVAFIDDLVEDLRRRDFTINAIAYDPISHTLHDPFDGRGDLERRLIRAVGEAPLRFAEDGLRLLRAVRFASQLGFAIYPQTRAAFVEALPTLRKVSRERVRDELLRLLAAPRPSVGLVHMLEPTAAGHFNAMAGLLGVVLPEVAAALSSAPDAPRHWMELVDAVPKEQRLATLLWPLRETAAHFTARQLSDRLDELLKLPNQERQHLAALLSFSDLDYRQEQPWSDAAVRRFMAGHAKQLIDSFLSIREAELTLAGATSSSQALTELGQRIAAERARRPPLCAADLAVSGKHLMEALGLRPGPAVGSALRHLLEYVLDDPQRNERAALLSEAARFLSTGPGQQP